MQMKNDSLIIAGILRNPLFVLIISALIVFTSFGIRQSFGLFLVPISKDLSWGRETLSFALASQNLMIGIAAPFAGALAARWGATRTVALGGLIFGLGILIMSQSTGPGEMLTSSGFMVGLGLGACGMPLILAIVSQVAPEKKRSLWLGIATASATGGQLMVVPLSQALLNNYNWVFSLIILSVLAGLIVPMALSMSSAVSLENSKDIEITMLEVIKEAAEHKGFLLLTAGFFVCGFHVAFIAVHLPAYLFDKSSSPALGATALMLIAFFNMIGAWSSGWLAGKVSKKYLLSTIYLIRSLIIFIFISLPIQPITVLLFSASIGMLWLSTVPPTSGLVSQIFGIRYMGMLYGFVYLGHQLGSFSGVWFGGMIFDITGSYNLIWQIAIGLGLGSAILHLPIDDRPVNRLDKLTT